MENPDQKQLNLRDTMPGTNLAQVAVVNAANNLVTFDFAYVHPRETDKPALDAAIVARVTMPIQDAKSFSDMLAKILDEHVKKLTEE